MLMTSNCHYIKTSFEAKYPSIFGLTPNLFKHQLSQLTKMGTFVNHMQLLKIMSISSGLMKSFCWLLLMMDQNNSLKSLNQSLMT